MLRKKLNVFELVGKTITGYALNDTTVLLFTEDGYCGIEADVTPCCDNCCDASGYLEWGYDTAKMVLSLDDQYKERLISRKEYLARGGGDNYRVEFDASGKAIEVSHTLAVSDARAFPSDGGGFYVNVRAISKTQAWRKAALVLRDYAKRKVQGG